MTRAEEVDKLKRLLAAREGQSGFARNVETMKARLAQLEAQDGD